MSVAPSITPPSPARIAANRLNAQRSSGPRTAAGKARSRANAVKHGLTGAGIALPTEDAAAVAGRFDALQAELAPSSVLGAILVKQVALMSVRLDRAALQESAALTRRVRHAIADFDGTGQAEVDALILSLEAGDPTDRARLLDSAAGVAALTAGLTGLRSAALARNPRDWTAAVAPRLAAYLGLGLEGDREAGSRTMGLFAATLGDFTRLNPNELHHLPGRGTWLRWALDQLLAAIDAELVHLATLRATRDDETLALDRQEAQTRALFDPGPEATLARKYEAEARRGLFRALREFRLAETAAAPTADVPDLEPPSPNEPNLVEAASAPCPNEPNPGDPALESSTPLLPSSRADHPAGPPLLVAASPSTPKVGGFWPLALT